MPIAFRCSQCQQLLRVPDTAAGKSARCPKCQALMTVPAGGEAETSISPPPETTTSSASPAAWSPPQETAASSPPKPPGADPFAFLQTPPPGSSPPKPPPEGNPFAETSGSPFAAGGSPFGGPATASLNPYASPATIGGYGDKPAWERSGLPWENERRSIGCWFRTMSMVVSSPTMAFMAMRREGGLLTPILFNVYGLGMIALVIVAIVTPFVLLLSLADGQRQGAEAVGFGVGMVLAIVAVAVVYVLLLATVWQLISAAIWHLFLMMCGGANHGYETTFRVSSYSYTSVLIPGILLSCVPYLGGFLMMIWWISLMIIGLSRAHETTTGKAALAVLLPFGLCMGSYILLIVLAVSGIFD